MPSLPDLSAAVEFAKLFGFPALCLGVMTWLLVRAAKAVHGDLLKPAAEAIIAAIRQAGPAAVAVRDEVAEIKETTARIESRLPVGTVMPGSITSGQPQLGNPLHA